MYGQSAEAETIRKMVVAMARDPKVLIVKLADRLHNIRTVSWLPPDKQQRMAKLTLEIYAPLAHRLGMNAIKWELEDLAFATLYPKRYDEIVRLVAERAPSRQTYLAGVSERVLTELRGAKIKTTVTGRPKHYWSIYQKMIVKGRDFDDIHDLIGAAHHGRHRARLLRRGRRDPHDLVPGARPVQGLHRDAEVQPLPIAAHDGDRAAGQPGRGPDPHLPDGPPRRVRHRGSLEVQGVAHHRRPGHERGFGSSWTGSGKPRTRASSWTPCGSTCTHKRCSCSPRRNDVIALPASATPVDFAYSVHTEVGHRCIGARVNGRLVPLESVLDNGDVVEVFTSKSETAGPSRDWLSFVKSPRARNKIRQWFAKERRDDAIDQGKDAISRAMRKAGLPLQRLMGGDALLTLAQDLRFADLFALYAAVGENHLSAQSVVQRLVHALGGPEGAVEDIAETETATRIGNRPRPAGDPGVVVKGATDVWAKLARCCTPVPGDEIVGFVTRGHGVSVHRVDCSNVKSLSSDPDRLLEVEWVPTAGSVFLVAIHVEALDRNRLLSDVTRVLSDAHVNILSAAVSTTRDSSGSPVSEFYIRDGRPETPRPIFCARCAASKASTTSTG